MKSKKPIAKRTTTAEPVSLPWWTSADVRFDGTETMGTGLIREPVAAHRAPEAAHRGPEPTARKPKTAKAARRPGEVARVMNLSTDTVREMFTGEPGVQHIRKPAKKGKRRYTTLRIPVEVFNRVRARLASC